MFATDSPADIFTKSNLVSDGVKKNNNNFLNICCCCSGKLCESTASNFVEFVANKKIFSTYLP